MGKNQEIDLESAIRFLLADGVTTPERICKAIDGVSLIEGCVVLNDTPWIADDGNAPIEYDAYDYTAKEAARQYVDGGDWGGDLDGSIYVKVCRVGIDDNGDDRNVQEEAFTIDLVHVLDHSVAIRKAIGESDCGENPDDHDWTSEGEGGLKENPGVWASGGTSMQIKSHCRKCCLHRTQYHTGSQRNPGEGDSVEYRSMTDEEIEYHRENGTIDF